MDFREIDSQVMPLLTSGRFREAESVLQAARVQASTQSDQYTLELVLAELAHLYCLMEPPDFSKAEMCCSERERVNPCGESQLQTAMMYYWSMRDPERTVHKAQGAAETARAEADTATLYQSLALLGVALVDLGRTDEATDLLFEMQRMVEAREKIIVGDETLFLERLATRTEQYRTRSTIISIARMLWPVCRDSTLASRLKRLAEE